MGCDHSWPMCSSPPRLWPRPRPRRARQGPFLEKDRIDIGVVTAIAAPASFHVDFHGNGGHAGGLLMPSRKDAGAPAPLALPHLSHIDTSHHTRPTSRSPPSAPPIVRRLRPSSLTGCHPPPLRTRPRAPPSAGLAAAELALAVEKATLATGAIDTVLLQPFPLLLGSPTLSRPDLSRLPACPASMRARAVGNLCVCCV